LSLRDDHIVWNSGTSGQADYLATPQVRITAKKEALVDVEGGRSSYLFQLNTAPDAVWRECLAEVIDNPPAGIHRADLRVEVTHARLTLRCMPSKLETKFAFVKAAVSETNELYREEKETVRRRVAEFDAQKQQAATAQKTRSESIRERFDRLEL
jgi:hypothetical protein